MAREKATHSTRPDWKMVARGMSGRGCCRSLPIHSRAFCCRQPSTLLQKSTSGLRMYVDAGK